MRNLVLIYGIAWGISLASLQAASVVTLADNQEFDGKLTLNPAAIHVEGAAPTEIDLPDILEADFTDTPFASNYFSSGNSPDQLPSNWKALDIGAPPHHGSFSYAKGAFTLFGWGSVLEGKEDQVYFIGRPWSGNGQWTVRLQAPDSPTDAESGLMLRDSLDPASPMVAIGLTGYAGRQTDQTPADGWVHVRRTAGAPPDLPIIYGSFPIWYRLTRIGPSISAALSDDGKTWHAVYQTGLQTATSAWIGFFTTSRIQGKPPGKAVLDEVSFTPPPCLARIVSPGVLLRSGSFLAGAFGDLEIDPAQPHAEGNFLHAGQNKPVVIPISKIAAVVLQSAERSELAGKPPPVGLIMRNGDFMEGDTGSISGQGATVRSLALGIVHYSHDEARAWVLHALQPQPAQYEVRLNDGSSLRASGLSVNDGHVLINEVSGIDLSVSQDEIAQFRAGSAEVQALIDLPWKAAASPVPSVANQPPPPGQGPPVLCWEGNNQEQIMAASAGTTIDFPLTGKFRALAMRVALSSDSPPNSSAVIHILADGREIGRTAPLGVGDPPRFVEVPLQDAKTITLIADTPFPDTKILYIDPVAIRV